MAVQITANRASTANTARQPSWLLIQPPSTGAISGAMVITRITNDIMRAARRPEYRSRTTARAITGPAAAPKPWMSRPTSNASMPVAKPQISVAAPYIKMPASNGRRRP